MKSLFSYRVNLASAYFAFWSFCFGTFLLLLFLATEADVVRGMGIAFTVIFMVLTTIALLILSVNALFNLRDIKQHLTAIFMVLLNIPFALFYIKLILSL